jgi:hypothetical protein
MIVYTYSESRQNLARLLAQALEACEVLIQRRDGQTFVVRPQARDASPLDVGKVNVRLTRDDILGAIDESRARLAEPRAAYRVRRRRQASKPSKRRAR